MIFKEGIPIYLQLTQEIANQILSGEYQPGDRIPSVRDLAIVYGVNPNTVQKALVLAEDKGLVYSKGPEGRFVSEDAELIHRLRHETIVTEVSDFIKRLKKLGIDKEAVIAQLQKGE